MSSSLEYNSVCFSKCGNLIPLATITIMNQAFGACHNKAKLKLIVLKQEDIHAGVSNDATQLQQHFRAK